MMLYGHRGAKGLATEDTLASFKVAMDYGVDGLEFDVRKTKDDILVLHHDDNLERVYGTNLSISNSSYNDLLTATKNHINPITTLDDVLKLADNFPLVIELKDTVSTKLLLKTLKKYPRANPLLITSFKKEALQEYRELGGTLPVYFAPSKFTWIISIPIAKKYSFNGLTLHKSCLFSPLHIIWSKRSRLGLIIYPVNSTFWTRALLKIRSDTAICTDYPNKFIKKS